MEPLQLFKPGESLSGMRDKLNALVRELKRLRNIQGAGIIVSHNSNGVLLAVPQDPLTVDDKYLLDSDYNMNTMVRRLSDLMSGDLGDVWRIRAHPTGTVRELGERRTLPGFRLMWLINYDGVAKVEGGWLTDSADVGFAKTGHSPPHVIATPKRRVAQIGDIIILTDDDKVSETPDGDKYTYANIRDDAHFHMSEARDGRIYFTTTAPGDVPTGVALLGEMVGDPAVKDSAYSKLKKESVEWRPQYKHPFQPDQLIYPAPEEEGYVWPVFEYITNSSKRCAIFLDSGDKGCWAADFQMPDKFGTLNIGEVIKYAADNASFLPLAAVFRIEYKVITPNNNESMSIAAGMTNRRVEVVIPAWATADKLLEDLIAIVPAAEYDEGDMIIIGKFYRDHADLKDTLADDVKVVGFEPCLTDEDPVDIGML